MLEILRYQFAKGYASRLDVAAQESQLAQVSATLPPLLKQLAQLRDLLAVLAGRFPSQAPADNFELSSLQLPEDLPVSLPSAARGAASGRAAGRSEPARRQRQDRHRHREPAAEYHLDRERRQHGAGDRISCSPRAPASGASVRTLTAPIFQGGTLLHQERAAKAAYAQAAEQYRSTVLTAFQNVADTLDGA